MAPPVVVLVFGVMLGENRNAARRNQAAGTGIQNQKPLSSAQAASRYNRRVLV
ncbi:hypothetical protein SBA4_20048 [Candidatus Sulfopaludibacter sp. SbA4]|nr:hypothetical protein SBA4_20048 [Candidatus Sulfopaludibacter sp. SbA4]